MNTSQPTTSTTSAGNEKIQTGLAGNNEDSDPGEVLTDVKLVSFAANPPTIGPFGVSRLEWRVAGVTSRVKVLLDNREVPAISQLVVQPPSTHAFHIAAVAGPARKDLGTVQVQVNLASCSEVEMMGAFRLMREILFNTINDGSSTYWSGPVGGHIPGFGPDNLSVTDKDGKIQFRMVFRKRIGSKLADLWVTLDGTFGLAVEDGRFVPVVEITRGSAKFPKVVGFLLGFVGGLALALNNADEQAKEQARAVIDLVVGTLNTQLVLPQGKRARTVQVGHRKEQSIITYTICDDV
jgi:hypothetical protein